MLTWNSDLLQGPWIQTDAQSHHRREFKYAVHLANGKPSEVLDTQVIDVFNDHLCYVISERRTPWSLPHARNFSILTKIVITHVAKSRCRFAVYAKPEWRERPLWPGVGRLVAGQALRDAKILAGALMGILEDQVAMMGSDAYNNSRKAVQIFGNVGTSKEILQPVLADLPTSSRERIATHTTTSIAVSAAKTTAINALLTTLGVVIHLLQAFAKVASAHYVLMLVLALSGLVNLYFANKDTWGWYRERQAKAFMRGVGVHPPRTGLGHSIWLRDLDALNSNHLTAIEEIVNTTATAPSACRSNFNALLAQTDPSSPPLSVALASSRDSDAKTLSRLQRARYTFGTYRHDLLVALRVVERVEKETIRAEWEGWVRNEIGKCRATRGMLDEGGAGKEVREWWERYCGSCEGEE